MSSSASYAPSRTYPSSFSSRSFAMRCCAAALSRVPFRTRPKQEAAILSHIFVGVGSHHFLKLSSVLRKHPVVPKSGKGLISQDWVWMSQKGCNVILQHRVTKLAEVMDCTSKCRYGSTFLARDLDFLRDEMLVSLYAPIVASSTPMNGFRSATLSERVRTCSK